MIPAYLIVSVELHLVTEVNLMNIVILQMGLNMNMVHVKWLGLYH